MLVLLNCILKNITTNLQIFVTTTFATPLLATATPWPKLCDRSPGHAIHRLNISGLDSIKKIDLFGLELLTVITLSI